MTIVAIIVIAVLFYIHLHKVKTNHFSMTSAESKLQLEIEKHLATNKVPVEDSGFDDLKAKLSAESTLDTPNQEDQAKIIAVPTLVPQLQASQVDFNPDHIDD